jgi:ABC-type multidrug transport system fused ATPase/permease subunit
MGQWPPQHGSIEFFDFSLKYRVGLNLILKHLTFKINGGEKIGIVGRTGAGKSSLTLALFRMVEAANSYWFKATDNSNVSLVDPNKTNFTVEEEDQTSNSVDDENINGGRIEIDGVDISTLGLLDLRQHLAIIPQEPVLFAGTVRENLDPFQEFEDSILWEALERSHIKDHVSSLSGGLSFLVAQNGENFSVGQRSLLCLARALLRKSKILILDEATSAVDMETDELIQNTIRTEFKDRTILTIAHRIKTVMDSDKILVLDQGEIVEFASPIDLLQDKNSLFYKLAKQAGEV